MMEKMKRAGLMLILMFLTVVTLSYADSGAPCAILKFTNITTVPDDNALRPAWLTYNFNGTRNTHAWVEQEGAGTSVIISNYLLNTTDNIWVRNSSMDFSVPTVITDGTTAGVVVGFNITGNGTWQAAVYPNKNNGSMMYWTGTNWLNESFAGNISGKGTTLTRMRFQLAVDFPRKGNSVLFAINSSDTGYNAIEWNRKNWSINSSLSAGIGVIDESFGLVVAFNSASIFATGDT